MRFSIGYGGGSVNVTTRKKGGWSTGVSARFSQGVQGPTLAGRGVILIQWKGGTGLDVNSGRSGNDRVVSVYWCGKEMEKGAFRVNGGGLIGNLEQRTDVVSAGQVIELTLHERVPLEVASETGEILMSA